MISRLSHALPRFVTGATLAGDGLQERLRSSTFALLGLVTAVGLVLVGIAANQGWPDFIHSPIPRAPTERVGEAGVAAEAVGTKGRPASDLGSHASTRTVRPDSGSDRSSELRISSQHEFPVTAPEGQSPAPAPAPAPGPDGAEAPGSPAEPPPAEPPSTAAPQPVQGTAPVSTSAPGAKPAAVEKSAPGKGKAKGHEKSHGPGKSHGPSIPTVPVVPTAPTAPPAASAPPSKAPPKEAPQPTDDAPGHGHGHAYGHDE